jgi:hypothetical protein
MTDAMRHRFTSTRLRRRQGRKMESAAKRAEAKLAIQGRDFHHRPRRQRQRFTRGCAGRRTVPSRPILCGLTEEEVLAVAEHEHLPQVAATAFAQCLLSRDHGSAVIRYMIVEDIRPAQRSGRADYLFFEASAESALMAVEQRAPNVARCSHSLYSAPVDRDTGLICDQTIAPNDFYAAKHYAYSTKSGASPCVGLHTGTILSGTTVASATPAKRGAPTLPSSYSNSGREAS